MSATNSTSTVSVDSLLQMLSPAASQKVSESSEVADVKTGADFSTLLGTFYETEAQADGGIMQKGEQENLHSGIEEESPEMAGFLAELDNQASQQLATVKHSTAQPVQNVTGDGVIVTEAPGQSPVLADAVRQSLDKAMENYMPEDKGDKRLAMVVSEESTVSGDRVAGRGANTSYIPVVGNDQSLYSLKTVPEQNLLKNDDMSRLVQTAGQLQSGSPADGLADGNQQSLSPVPATGILTGTQVSPSEINHATPAARQDVNPLATTTLVQQNPDVPKGHEVWLETVGQRLVAMVGEKRQEASIRLDPPELGSLHVRLVVEDSGVSVQFQSAVSHVREMLEGQADRLRYALAGQGLDLVNVDVGKDDNAGQQQPFQKKTDTPSSYIASEGPDDSEASLDIELDTGSIAGNGFINTFA